MKKSKLCPACRAIIAAAARKRYHAVKGKGIAPRDPEQANEYMRKWRAKNREHYQEYQRNYQRARRKEQS